MQAAAAALKMAVIKLVRHANSPAGTSCPKKLPSSTNNGVPGGWGIPRIRAAAMNSPASQKVTLGASVTR
jgi:hypothetical protein